jgi:RimJ/RimL family protein N-acetyltransferase
MEKHLTNFFEIVSLELWEKRLADFPPFKVAEHDFKIEVTTPARCRDIASQSSWGANFKVTLDEILRDSDVCFVATKDSRLVHWTHAAFRSTYIEEIGKRIRPNSNSAYIFGVFTAPNFRNFGVASAVIQEASFYLSDKGTDKIFILIDKHNSSMRKILTQAGFKKTGFVKLFRLGKMRLLRCNARIRAMLSSR